MKTLADCEREAKRGERNMNELDSPYGEGNGLGTTEDEDEFLDYTNNELVNFLKNSDDKMKKEYAAYELTKRMDKLKDLTRTDNI